VRSEICNKASLGPIVIDALIASVAEEQWQSNLRHDLPLVVLGSIIAAIGLAAVLVQLFQWKSRDRVLLWLGLFAGPYGVRLLTNSVPFQIAFGEPHRCWPFVSRLIEFATIVPALLLFEDFYGKRLAFVRPLVDVGLCAVRNNCIRRHRNSQTPRPSSGSWHWNCFPLAGRSSVGTPNGIFPSKN
jgi:hypothetical protein